MSDKKTRSHKAQKVIERLGKKLNRQIVGSLVACVHCGMCTDSCHYVLANPGDPTYAPAYKGDKIRKLFKRHFDWTGRVFPWWVKAGSVYTDEELEELKDTVFGKCTNCRRCSLNCPMGVDLATFNRMARGLLVSVGDHARGRGRGQQGPVGDRQPDGRAQGGLPRDARVDDRGTAGRAGRPHGDDSHRQDGLRHRLLDQPARGEVRPAHASPTRPRSSTPPARTGPCPARAGT